MSTTRSVQTGGEAHHPLMQSAEAHHLLSSVIILAVFGAYSALPKRRGSLRSGEAKKIYEFLNGSMLHYAYFICEGCGSLGIGTCHYLANQWPFASTLFTIFGFPSHEIDFLAAFYWLRRTSPPSSKCPQPFSGPGGYHARRNFKNHSKLDS